VNAWAKPAVNLWRGDCGKAMQPEDAEGEEGEGQD